MKTKLATILLALAITGISTAATITGNSTISAVTVYQDRAVVTRSANIKLPAGESTITLEKLPSSLIDASIQVSARGTSTATILDVASKITFTPAAENPRVKDLQDQITAVEQSIRSINDRDSILQQQAALIFQIESALTTPVGNSTRPTLDDLQKLIPFSIEARTKLASDRQLLANELRDTNQKLTALRNQLNEITRTTPAAKNYKTISIRLSAETAGTLTLQTAYTLPGASWTPTYDARLNTSTRELSLSYFAIVRQSTGEDWSNIALTLSTARPSLGGQAPELSPWFINFYQPVTRDSEVYQLGSFAVSGKREGNAAAKTTIYGNADALNRVALAEAPALEMAYQDASHATATVQSATTSASFKITATTSIPSDNTPQKVSITTVKLPAKLQYQSTPSLQETAFLSAYLTNTTDFPFLAGSTNTFLDDSFVATTPIKTVMPTEKFELSLGADEGVSIKRRIVNRFTEDIGILSKSKRVTYEYLLTITNNKKTPERVVFKEPLPISQNEKLIVSLLTPSEKETGTKEKPGKEVTREENNTLVFRLDLAPSQKREIPLKFSIEYPADQQVTNLD